jgi:hypothetical protein
MTGLRKHGRVARPHDEDAFLARVGPKSEPPCFFEPPTIVGAISFVLSLQAFAPFHPPLERAKALMQETGAMLFETFINATTVEQSSVRQISTKAG